MARADRHRRSPAAAPVLLDAEPARSTASSASPSMRRRDDFVAEPRRSSGSLEPLPFDVVLHPDVFGQGRIRGSTLARSSRTWTSPRTSGVTSSDLSEVFAAFPEAGLLPRRRSRLDERPDARLGHELLDAFGGRFASSTSRGSRPTGRTGRRRRRTSSSTSRFSPGAATCRGSSRPRSRGSAMSHRTRSAGTSRSRGSWARARRPPGARRRARLGRRVRRPRPRDRGARRLDDRRALRPARRRRVPHGRGRGRARRAARRRTRCHRPRRRCRALGADTRRRSRGARSRSCSTSTRRPRGSASADPIDRSRRTRRRSARSTASVGPCTKRSRTHGATDVDGILLAAAGVHVEAGAIDELGELVPGRRPGRARRRRARLRHPRHPARSWRSAPVTSGATRCPPARRRRPRPSSSGSGRALRIGRDGTVVALGGGSTTDVAGIRRRDAHARRRVDRRADDARRAGRRRDRRQDRGRPPAARRTPSARSTGRPASSATRPC